MGFVRNLLLFPAMKEFRKSVKNWQSYRHEFDVLLFWDSEEATFEIINLKICNSFNIMNIINRN